MSDRSEFPATSLVHLPEPVRGAPCSPSDRDGPAGTAAPVLASPSLRRAWLQLTLTQGVGPVNARRAYALSGPDAPLGSSAWLARVRAAAPRLATRVLGNDPARDQRMSQTLTWLDAPDRHLLTWDDPGYPPRLRDLDDAPPLLFAQGDPTCLQVAPGLAIVGSRHASSGGARHARAFAQALADLGWTIVSGLARGIDAAAHEGALAAAHGRTVAVLGNGLDTVYPRQHASLAARITGAGGLLLSELPPGTEPLRAHFPRRNRLIAALAQGVLVVEAARGSGSLITAQWAADLGREVFAIPGSIDAPQSRGCHHLIREGAHLVEGIADLLEELPDAPRAAAGRGRPPSGRAGGGPEKSGSAHTGDQTVVARSAGTADPVDSALLAALGWDPWRIEELALSLPMEAAGLGAGLLRLELSGQVERLADGRYQRLRTT